jgi:16S rRNA (uracil1498-N3)-methyltransferase
VPAGTLVDGASITLDADEAHHLEVRRILDGTAARALDGVGGLGLGHLHHDGVAWQFAVEMTVIEPRPAPTVLAVGAGDRDRFLLVAEKCAELGVTRLIPVETQLTRSVESRVREATIAKAGRRVREACKQAGNAWLPEIDPVRTLDELGAVAPGLQWWLADGRGDPIPELSTQQPVGWLIGPEGGLTEEEIAAAEQGLGATKVSLGRHVLRFETAAIVAAAVTDAARTAAAQARRH